MATIQIVKSKIELEIENMPQAEADILKDYFVLLIQAQIHTRKNCKVILFFDNDGLAQVGDNNILWRRKTKKI